MPHQGAIDERLFGHILLDPELQGRHDLQGNRFAITIPYLNTYLNHYFKAQKKAITPKFQALCLAMESLVQVEQAIDRVGGSGEQLALLQDDLFQRITQLKTGEYIILPGGWNNHSDNHHGHAMAYQFTQTSEGLEFSIYNAGAGIHYHEKTSSKSNDRYYPVRTHRITKTDNTKELNILLKRLLLAKLPNQKRSHPILNEKYLYHDIDKSLTHLDATQRLVSQNLSEELTTAGQISGTCAQRVLHQLLKINFGNLSDYQQFMFQFKMHALRDFTAAQSSSSPSSSVDLIRLGIKHIAKILKNEHVVDEVNKSEYIRELSELKQKFNAPTPLASPLHAITENPEANTPWSIEITSPILEEQKTPDTVTAPKEYRPIISLDSHQDLLLQLDAVIEDFKEVSYDYEGFALEQIEAIIVALPLPISFDPEYLKTFTAYEEITQTPEKLQHMKACLQDLQDIYSRIHATHFGQASRAHYKIVHAVFIGLYDFLLASEGITTHAYNTRLKDVFESYEHSPSLATYNPIFDDKFSQILTLYKTKIRVEYEPIFDEFSRVDIQRDPLLDYYKKAFISRETDRILNRIYDIYHHKKTNTALDRWLRENQLIALYTLFNFVTNNGTLDEGLWNAIKHALEEKHDNLDSLKQLKNESIQPFLEEIKRELFFTNNLTGSFGSSHSYSWIPTLTMLGYGVNFSSPIQLFTCEDSYVYAHSSEGVILSEDMPQRNKELQSILHPRDFNAKKILQKRPWSSNEIQVHGAKLNKQDDPLVIHDLMHLRTSPVHQIQLTFDHFKHRHTMSQLTKRSTQIYVRDNLFERAHLEALLRHDQNNFLLQFDAFIQSGLQLFLDHQALMTQDSLFFLELRYLVHQYLAPINQDKAYARLQHDLQHLTDLIHLPHEEALQASFHQYRFLTAIKLHSQSKDPDLFFSEMLQSLFFLQAKKNPQAPNDVNITSDIARSQYHMQAWIEHIDIEVLKDTIRSAVCGIGIDVSDYSIEGQHPNVVLISKDTQLRYDIDLMSGLVFNDNRALSMIPDTMKHHPYIQQFGLEQERSCFISMDKNTLEFITPQQQIRIKKTGESSIILEKIWTVGGFDSAWYELCTTDHALPELCHDKSITIWINAKDELSLIVNGNQPIAHSNQHGELEQLDDDYKQNGYVLSTYHGQFSAELEQFEDAGFIMPSHKNDHWKFYLPRYDLHLETHDDQLYLYGTDYTVTDKPSPFSDEVACLNLSNARDHQILVAVKPFKVIPQAQGIEGDYYPLQHNRHDLPKQAITYQIINGVPKANKPMEALYLSYIYLAMHQPEKAWEVLDGIIALECTYSELMLLEWITNKLPVTQNEDHQIDNPAYLACQLKALALLTGQLEENKKPDFPERDADKEIENFYKELPKTIGELFTKFQIRERHLSHPFFLNNTARRSLLNTYQHLRLDDLSTIKIDHTFDTLGALGYQSRRLSLETLLKEQKHLKALEKTLSEHDQTLPSRFARRLDEIDRTVRTECRILKKLTKLEKREIIPKRRSDLDYSELSLTIASSLNDDAIANMTSDITDDEFVRYAPDYLHIAFYYSEKSAPYKALKTLCSRILRDNIHPSSEKKSANFEGLLHGLYRLLCADKHVRHDIQNAIIEKRNKVYNAYSTFNLNDDLSITHPAPIIVYQAEDVFDELLADDDQILHDLAQDMPAYTPLTLPKQKQPNIYSMQAFKEKLFLNLDGYQAFSKSYTGADQTYQDALTIQLEQLDNLENSENLHGSQLQQEREAEQAAGRIKFECSQAQKTAAVDYFNNTSVIAQLKQQAEAFQVELHQVEDTVWMKAIGLANQPSNQANVAHVQAIEKIAGLRQETLTQNDLIMLYFHADETRYLEMTGLDVNQVKDLHQLIHTAVTQSVERAHLDRVIQTLEGDKPNDAVQVASTLMSENAPEAQNDPGLMVFQYQENILLRPRQCLALNNLLSKSSDDDFQYNESVEKVIMGGGKSKVLLPLLAQKKADGHSLVIIEVPRPLLETNYTDLAQTSRNLFHQKTHCFRFNRDSECSPERLEDIYNQFIASMTNKDYWVTTGEAIQSLELKYLELLLADKPDDPKQEKIWQQQIHWMSKITHVVREFGDVIIDEVHQGLLLKKELNYSLGAPLAVEVTTRELSIKLYRFLSLISEPPEKNTALLRTEAMRMAWSDCIPQLIMCMIEDERSPLQEIITLLKTKEHENIKESLSAYLSNQAAFPRIEELSPAIRDALAFYKEQISSLLPHTLPQKHRVTYGPSNEKRHASLSEQLLAVPYVANSQPSESSDFSHLLTKINYTIQSLLIDGLNQELLIDMVQAWLAKARLELDNDPNLQGIADTSMAIGVNHCLKGTGFTLQSLNIKDTQQMQALFLKVRFKQDLILNMLEYNILEKICIEPELLHSNALNHVDLYHSVQGLSGTPYNITTFHQRLGFNRKTALGTDGYLLETLKQKTPAIHGINFTNTQCFIAQVLGSIQAQKPRAIIDVGAMFTGIQNNQVAEALADYLLEHHQQMQHVLYFNQDNILCAFDIHQKQVVLLTSSSPHEINQKLGNTPEERFTYYDQAHTVGADLKQSANSTGVVLIDPKTQIQGFLQGAMRMRGLEANQSIEIVATQAMAEQSLEDLYGLMTHNEEQQLMDDNFNAAAAKMENIVRNHLIKTIQDLPEVPLQINYAHAFKHYFVKSLQGRLFEQYGAVASMEDTEHLLEQYKAHLLDDLKQNTIIIDSEHVKKLGLDMHNVIEEALPYCQKTTQTQRQSFDQECETQVQKENQIIMEQNKQLEQESREKTRTARAYSPWTLDELLKFTKHKATQAKSLNQACKSKRFSLFSEELLISSNQELHDASQSDMFTSDLKPVYSVLCSRVNNKVIACLITNEEARDLGRLLSHDQFSDQDVWIDTSQNTLLSGHRPADVVDMQKYKTLIEQVRFFNGEFSLLNHQEEPWVWMQHDVQEKIYFYEGHLSRYRSSPKADFTLFEAKASTQLAGFRLLREHRFEPLNLDWDLIYPDALDTDIKTLKALASAFHGANQMAVEGEDIDLDALIEKHGLPLEAMEDLKKHTALLTDSKQLLNRLESKLKLSKMPIDTIIELNNLMSIISGHQDRVSAAHIDFSHATTKLFFKNLGAMTPDEWMHFIESNYFEQIILALSPNKTPDEFVALWIKYSHDVDESLWIRLVQELNSLKQDKILGAFIKNEDKTLDINKKVLLLQHAREQRWYPLQLIPNHQLDEMIPLLLSKAALNEQEVNILRDKTQSVELKRQIVLHKYSVMGLLMRFHYIHLQPVNSDSDLRNLLVSPRNTSVQRQKLLTKLEREVRDNNAEFKQIDRYYLLQFIEAICEYEKPKSFVHRDDGQGYLFTKEYKEWSRSNEINTLFSHAKRPLTHKKWDELMLLLNDPEPLTARDNGGSRRTVSESIILKKIYLWQQEDHNELTSQQEKLSDTLLASIQVFKSPTNDQDLNQWIVDLETAFINFKNNKDMIELKNACAELEAQGKLLKSSYSSFEDIYHGLISLVQSFFYIFDCLLSIGSDQTMAETETPFAKRFTGRNHFFESPQKTTEYNAAHLLALFEQACHDVEALAPPPIHKI